MAPTTVTVQPQPDTARYLSAPPIRVWTKPPRERSTNHWQENQPSDGREMHQLTYRLAIRAFRLLFVLLGLRIDLRGEEHLPTSGPAIVACNHIGFLDFALVGLAADQRHRLVRFMAKQSAFDNPVSGPLMRAMGHIPVDRSCGAPAARQARDELRRGELVGIFPEATISRAWTLKPFMRGAATLAVREQVPLLPVVVWGGHRVLTVDGRWSLRRGKAVTILIGAPIIPAAVLDVGAANAELRRQMQDLLDRAQRDYPDLPRDDSDRWWLPEHLGGSAPTPQVAAELDTAALNLSRIRRPGADRRGRSAPR